MQYSPFLAMLLTLSAEFSTYIGDEHAWRISKLIVDASGNTYVAGSRTFDLGYDAFSSDLRTEAVVVKLDSTGKRLLFAGIGGKGNDIVNAVAVDRSGNLYLGGSTTSPNFPVRNPLYSGPTGSGQGIFTTPGFVTKLSPDGAIVYSTYFPSPIQSIAVDIDGAAYVAGTTYSSSFPTTTGLPKGPASTGIPIVSAAFLTKIAPSGGQIVYSALISGQNKPCGAGSSCFTSSRGASGVAVAVDGAGNAYLAGNSDVTDLPTTPGVLTPSGTGAFLAKVNAAGTGLAYLTYLGAGAQAVAPRFTPATIVRALAVDAAGNAHAAGETQDPKLPFPNRFHGWTEIDPGIVPPPDAFAMKLNPTGSAVVWGRYLGGDGMDAASAATLDAAGNLWVAGTTRSAEFPNADGWSTGEDFIVKFDSAGELPYSARYPNATVRQTIALDSAGLIHAAGPGAVVHAVAASPRPAMRPWSIGPLGGQVAPGEVIAIYGPHIGGPVFIDDVAAPVLYSGDGQVNTIVPFEIAGRKTVRIRIGAGPEFVAGVLPAIPQIFVAVNQDGTVNSPDNPARVGSIMTAWVTGSGYPEHLGLLYADGKPVAKVYEGGYQINFVAPAAGSIVLTSGKYGSAPLEIHVVP
jgi:hypothetical protein